MLAQRIARFQHQIAPPGGDAACKRAADRKTVAAGFFDVDAIAVIGKDHQHVEKMIAVVTSPGHMQRQIDLCRRKARYRWSGVLECCHRGNSSLQPGAQSLRT